LVVPIDFSYTTSYRPSIVTFALGRTVQPQYITSQTDGRNTKCPAHIVVTGNDVHSFVSPERQSARMSKITNDGLTRSGTAGCFIATHMATVGVKRLPAQCAQKYRPTVDSWVLSSCLFDPFSPLVFWWGRHP